MRTEKANKIKRGLLVTLDSDIHAVTANIPEWTKISSPGLVNEFKQVSRSD